MVGGYLKTKILNYMFPSYYKIKNKLIRWHLLWGFFLFPFVLTVSLPIFSVALELSNEGNSLLMPLAGLIIATIWTLISFHFFVGFIVRRPKFFKIWLTAMVVLYTAGFIHAALTTPLGDSDLPLFLEIIVTILFTFSPLLMAWALYAMVQHGDKDFDVAIVNFDLGKRLFEAQKYFLAFAYLEDLAFKKRHRLSLSLLGSAFENGVGKDKNLGNAFACYTSAWENGHEESFQAVQRLEQLLTEKDVIDSKTFKKDRGL